MPLKINEIFHSIQGESIFSGIPCVFVRLTGCNLRCTYCDTGYAFEEGEHLTIDTILKKIAYFSCNLVEITGGEPLMQGQTPALAKVLLDQGYHVLMETNGSLDIGLVDNRCIRIVDMKCPSSGQSHKNNLDNLKHLTGKDQLKFVIGDVVDFKFAKDFLEKHQPAIPGDHILFSPVMDKLPLDELAKWILGHRLPVRMQIQLHRIIWPDTDRGV